MNHRYIDFVPQNQPKEEIPEEKPVIRISFASDEPEVYTDEPEVYADEPVEEYIEEESYEEEYDEEEYDEDPAQISIRKITTITPTETSEITEVVKVVNEPEIEEKTEVEEPELEPEVEDPAPEDEPEFDLDTPIEELMAAKDDDNFDFGVIEDYVPVNEKRPAFISAPTFMNTKVEKRPLYDRSDIEKIKAERILKKPVEKPVEKPAEEAPKTSQNPFSTFKKIPFINTNLVEKRPLSKTNYRDRAPIPQEEESGPVTIIDNEGKGGRIGLIVTIVLTIILGAAVGTIAFLLMPR